LKGGGRNGCEVESLDTDPSKADAGGVRFLGVAEKNVGAAASRWCWANGIPDWSGAWPGGAARVGNKVSASGLFDGI
jgi:hypothetical protein